jgi:hypothetical protein
MGIGMRPVAACVAGQAAMVAKRSDRAARSRQDGAAVRAVFEAGPVGGCERDSPTARAVDVGHGSPLAGQGPVRRPSRRLFPELGCRLERGALET